MHAINPDSNYILTPDSIGWEYEELRIRTEDNFELNTWIYAPNPETDKTAVIILAYPDAGNMSYFVYHAATLAKEGFTVVTFDYRGFGKSSDFEINPDNLYYLEFSKDLEAVVDNISNKFSNKKVGIWSLSMGTIITSRTYSNIREELDFIIGEGFVTNTAYMIDRYGKRGKNLILPEPETTYTQIGEQIDVPLLILAASKDEITTVSDALELQEKLAYKELLAAQLYLNLGNYMGNNYEAAVVTAREAMKIYPYSIYLEEYQITILRARYEYAQRSALHTQPERFRMVVDEYYNYTNTFPEGKFSNEAQRYYNEAQSKIEILPTT